MLPLKIKVTKIKGKGRGKKLGVPTLNFAIPPDFNLSYGVYAGRLKTEKSIFPAAIHYGPRPVFDEKDISLEAYIINRHSGDPPVGEDSRIPMRFWTSQNDSFELEFIKYIREIKNFATPEIMVSRINKDIEEIQQALKVIY